MQRIAQIAILVREYDEAIRFYSEKLGFKLVEDTDLGGGKRWARVAPPGTGGTELLLARAVNEEQASRIGNQTGGRVFLFSGDRRFSAGLRSAASSRRRIHPAAWRGTVRHRRGLR